MYTPFFYLRFAFLFLLPLIVFAETSYEPNNTIDDATPLYVNGVIQEHNFDYTGDQDWLVEHFPKADITFDRFHIVKLLNKAMDTVRKQERKEHEQLKGHKYTFLKNKLYTT